MPYSTPRPLQVACAQAGAHALQAALRLGLGGSEAEALLDLDVHARRAASLGRLGHGRASGGLGTGAHLEPHRSALGQTLAERAQSPALQLLQVGGRAVRPVWLADRAPEPASTASAVRAPPLDGRWAYSPRDRQMPTGRRPRAAGSARLQRAPVQRSTAASQWCRRRGLIGDDRLGAGRRTRT